MESLISQTKTIQFVFNKGNSFPPKDIYLLDNHHLTITSSNQGVNSPVSSLIFSLIEKEIKAVKNFVINKNEYLGEIVFDLAEKGDDFFPSEKYMEIYKRAVNWNRSSRKIIPCLKRYNKLQLKNSSKLPYLYHFHVSHTISFEYPKMVSPFVVIENSNEESENKYDVSIVLNDKVYDWVFENRFDKTTTKDDIIKAYDEFVKEFSLDSLKSNTAGATTENIE